MAERARHWPPLDAAALDGGGFLLTSKRSATPVESPKGTLKTVVLYQKAA